MAAASVRERLQQLAAQSDGMPAQELAAKLLELSSACLSQSRGPGAGATHAAGATAGQQAQAAATEPAAAPAAAPEEAREESPGPPLSKKARKAPREFDESRYRRRFVALELMYFGAQYQGFARQEGTDRTIEGQLFAAMRRTRLIPEDPAALSQLQYSRCGRTDKGVSALGQVIAIRLRSNARVVPPADGAAASASQPGGAGPAPEGQQPAAPDALQAPHPSQQQQDEDEQGLPPVHEEINYPQILNRALPPDIRILGWTPVPTSFNARFSCRYREYKYFIVDRGDQLDLGAMRQAAALLVGHHDFRNFCKQDVLAVRSFDRHILSFTLEPFGVDANVALPPGPPQPPSSAAPPAPGPEGQQQQEAGVGGGSEQGPPEQLQQALASRLVVGRGPGAEAAKVYAFTVRGTAFLWHQVRCMVAVLLMVGRHQEQPSVITRLLDINATPAKPCYTMAPEEPLLLYACGYHEGLRFIRAGRLPHELLEHVRGVCDGELVATALSGAVAARLHANLLDAQEQQQQQQEQAAAQAGQGKRKAGGGQGGGGGGGAGGGGVPHVPLLRRPVEMTVAERMAKAGITELGGASSRKVAAGAEEADGE